MNKSFHTYKRDNLFAELNTTPNGLTTTEANERLFKNGKNVLPEGKKKSAFKKIISQFLDPMIIVLILASVASFVVSFIEHTEDYIDAIIIIGIVIFNAIIGYIQEQKAENAIDELKKLSQKTAKVIRDGKQMVVPAENLVVGDKVVFEAGDIIPADLYLLETASLKINESSLTGESNAVDKLAEQGLRADLALGDRRNMAYSSSVVVNGRGMGIVVATGINTEIGKIADLLKITENEQTLLQKNLAQLGKFITVVVLAVATLILFLDLLLTDTSFMDSFMTAVAIAVAAIPESLPAVVTIIMAVGVTRMSKRNAIVKRLHAVETLGACEIICTDKTGTLTQNNMVVKSVYLCNHFENFDKELTKSQKDLLNCMIMCNDSVIMGSKAKGDPTETALIEFAERLNYRRQDTEVSLMRVAEIPFDSNRKLMTTIHTVGANQVIYTKGAIDNLSFHAPLTNSSREKCFATPFTPKLKSMPWNVTGVSLSIMSSPPACQLMTSSADAISTLSPLSFTGSSASCFTVDVSLNGLYSAFLSNSVPCAALYSSVACANNLFNVGNITFVPSFVPIWYGWRIALLFSRSNICFCNERACL